jgi:hypothetical protein
MGLLKEEVRILISSSEDFQCAGFRAETGAGGGRDRLPPSGIFKDLAIWRGRQRWQISIRNAPDPKPAVA